MYIKNPVPLQEALSCAASYGWAVFPASKNKVPRTPNGHKAASTDPYCIRAMWQQFGGLLVGIRTGQASNLAVLDIDRQHDGGTWWQANRHQLPLTRVHRTRSGGLHVLFTHCPGLRCSTARVAPGIDVKAEGGAIIYWPAAGFPILCNAPLAAWPDWLVPAPPPPVPMRKDTGPRPAVRIEAQLAGLVRKIATTGEGQRNTTLFWAASRTAEIIAQGELSKPHAEAVLIAAAEYAGMENFEAVRTIESAFTRSNA